MDAALANSLQKIVSAQRFDRYREAATNDLESIVLYCWNIQLSEALVPTLAMLEVTLRNAVHDRLAHHTGTEWWFKPVLHQQSYDNILKLIGDLTRRQGTPPAIGKVISEITFGFWPKLFAHSYQSFWWEAPNRLLSQVLPNHPAMARDVRNKFEERLEYSVALRNRVMHHEAIFQGVRALNRPVLSVDTLHDQIIETIGWIDAEAGQLASCLDRFGGVFDSQGLASLEQSLRDTFIAS